jgi:hypothetical protein
MMCVHKVLARPERKPVGSMDAIDQIFPPTSVPTDATLGGNKRVKEVGELGSLKRRPVMEEVLDGMKEEISKLRRSILGIAVV